MTQLALLLASEGNGYWLPHDIGEVFGGSAAFFIVVGIIWWKAGPAIKGAMAKRTDGIQQDLDQAAETRQGAEAERDQIKSALADREREVARIHADAEATAAKASTGHEHSPVEAADLARAGAARPVAVTGLVERLPPRWRPT